MGWNRFDWHLMSYKGIQRNSKEYNEMYGNAVEDMKMQ